MRRIGLCVASAALHRSSEPGDQRVDCRHQIKRMGRWLRCLIWIDLALGTAAAEETKEELRTEEGNQDFRDWDHLSRGRSPSTEQHQDRAFQLMAGRRIVLPPSSLFMSAFTFRWNGVHLSATWVWARVWIRAIFLSVTWVVGQGADPCYFPHPHRASSGISLTVETLLTTGILHI
jgi:hypothetical protein